MSRLQSAVAVVGLALVAGGVALVVLGNQPADFGWTASSPLPAGQDAYRSSLRLTSDDGPAGVWTRTAAFGAGIAVVGLLVPAVLAGGVAGRRSSRHAID